MSLPKLCGSQNNRIFLISNFNHSVYTNVCEHFDGIAIYKNDIYIYIHVYINTDNPLMYYTSSHVYSEIRQKYRQPYRIIRACKATPCARILFILQ